MTALALLAEVEQAGGSLLLDGDSLKVRAPAPLTADLMGPLKEGRADVVAELRRRAAPPPTTGADRTPCHACRGRRFWRSVQAARSSIPEERERLICGKCHPPAFPELVAEWIDGPEPEPALLVVKTHSGSAEVGLTTKRPAWRDEVDGWPADFKAGWRELAESYQKAGHHPKAADYLAFDVLREGVAYFRAKGEA